MRSVVFFSTISLLAACNTRNAPAFPDVDLCQGYNEDGTREAQCFSAYASKKRDYTIHRYTPFDKGYVMTPLGDYQKLLKWKDDMQDWAQRYCK